REISGKYGGAVYVDYVTLLKSGIFIRDAMADLSVSGCAYAFRESLIVQGSGNAAVFYCEAWHDLVDFGGAHPDTDMLSDFVEDGSVKSGACLDLLDLRRCFQKFPRGHDLPFFCVNEHFFFDRHVAFFIFFPAATPAKVISFHELHL